MGSDEGVLGCCPPCASCTGAELVARREATARAFYYPLDSCTFLLLLTFPATTDESVKGLSICSRCQNLSWLVFEKSESYLKYLQTFHWIKGGSFFFLNINLFILIGGRGWDDLAEWHWNMYNIIYEMNRQSRGRFWIADFMKSLNQGSSEPSET